MRGAAVISTGWERTGVVLKTVEIGRRETVRVSRRVPSVVDNVMVFSSGNVEVMKASSLK